MGKWEDRFHRVGSSGTWVEPPAPDDFEPPAASASLYPKDEVKEPKAADVIEYDDRD